MAPIKSSIDLAMERTEGLRLSAEERERQRRKGTSELAASLILRWQEQRLRGEDLLREVLSREEAHPGLRRQVLEQAVGSVGLQGRSASLLELVRLLEPDKAEQLRQVLAAYRQRVEGRKHTCREEARRNLMHKGISGTAVEPNEAGWTGWADWVAQQERAMQEDLLALLSHEGTKY